MAEVKKESELDDKIILLDLDGPPDDLLNAQNIDPERPGLWSKGMRKNWWVVLFGVFALASNGYDASLTWSLPILKTFTTDVSGADNYSLATIDVFNHIGAFLAPFCYTPIFDGLGRKKGVLIGSFFAFIGVCLQTFGTLGDNKTVYYLIGRLVNQFGIAIAGAVANMYIMENGHPAWRAFFGGIFGGVWVWGMYVAQLAVFIVTFAPENSWQWRGPIVFQMVWVFILGYMYFTVPESPRFLVSRGREEEAREAIRVYQANGDGNNPMIDTQMEDLKKHVIDYSKWNWRDAYNPMPLFNTANMRRRMLILIMVGPIWTIINAAPTGGVFETNIYELLGVTNPSVKQGMDIGGSVFSVIGAYFGSYGPERYGRRFLQTYGYFIAAIFMAIQALGMDMFGRYKTFEWAVLFFVSRYIAGFWSAFIVAPSANLFIDELMPFENRARVLWILQTVGSLISLGMKYVQAWSLTVLGNQVYWYVTFYSFFQWFTIWLLVPETKGRTLEHVGVIFDHPNPVKYSLKVVKENEEYEKRKKETASS